MLAGTQQLKSLLKLSDKRTSLSSALTTVKCSYCYNKLPSAKPTLHALHLLLSTIKIVTRNYLTVCYKNKQYKKGYACLLYQEYYV